MKKNWFFVLFIFLCFSINLQAQCKVLNEKINESYTGDCKKNLAHGTGVAKGVDSYAGEFIKGLMHGKGTYTFANGDKYIGNWVKGQRSGFGEFIAQSGNADSKKGIWKKDAFVKTQQFEVMYDLIQKINVSSVSFRKLSEGNRIYVKFKGSNGGDIGVGDISVTSSEGIEISDKGNCGFDNANFPLTGIVTFRAKTGMSSFAVDYKVEFKIFEPGKWEVQINF